jgi:hypothetical protein
VDEVDVHAVDLGRELRQRVEPRLDPPEVVLGRPVPCERLQRRKLDPLRPIADELFARPPRGLDASAEVSNLLVGDLDLEGPDHDGGLNAAAHA